MMFKEGQNLDIFCPVLGVTFTLLIEVVPIAKFFTEGSRMFFESYRPRGSFILYNVRGLHIS